MRMPRFVVFCYMYVLLYVCIVICMYCYMYGCVTAHTYARMSEHIGIPTRARDMFVCYTLTEDRYFVRVCIHVQERAGISCVNVSACHAFTRIQILKICICTCLYTCTGIFVW
jgi:hypothetical protein